MLKDYDKIHPQRKDFAPLFGPGKVPGYLSDGDMSTAIPYLCGRAPDQGLMVEVGSFLGKSAVEWARNFQHVGKPYKILCIDSFNSPIPVLHDLLQEADFEIPNLVWDQLELFKHYTSGHVNIKPIKTFFDDKFVFPARAQVIFEDSTHTQKYLAKALPFWWQVLTDGGILAGHDYAYEVRAAVDLFAALNDLEVHTFANSSIWYIEKC